MEDYSAIKNIVNEIMRECTYKNIQTHENFLTYYVNLLALDSRWGLSFSNVMSNRSDVQNFVKEVVSRCQDKHSPSLITLRMQFYFNCNFEGRTKLLTKTRAELMQRLKTLQSEIIEMQNADNIVGTAYRKIIYYITLASGLGNPTLQPVYLEVQAALKSIVNEGEMQQFLGQQRFVKEEQLEEDFLKVVTGIRLFNKDCSKGGEGIEDLTRLLSCSLETVTTDMEETLIHIMDKVNLLTTIIDDVYTTVTSTSRSHHIVCNLPDNVDISHIESVKDHLVVYRQYELYMRKLIEEVEKIEESANEIFLNLQTTFNALHETCKNRTAIPVEQVFPTFKKLAETWYQLQDETILLSRLNQISINLNQYIKQLRFDESIIDMMGPITSMTDAERLERTTGLRIHQKANSSLVLDLNIFKDIDKVHLEYLGFCSWKIVETQGGLIPGNPNMGIAKVMNKNYVFSSLEAAEAFGQAPESYVLEAINLARQKPELINFLQIKEQLVLVRDIKELVQKPLDVIPCFDTSMQSELHPVPVHIDPAYKWNTWDIKREAIMLANLSKCRTLASQTEKSSLKCSVQTQTYEQKEKNEQTRRDNYTNVPKPSMFIFGLRGRRDDKQFIVDLTRPVEE